MPEGPWWIVTLIVPAIAILAYWLIARSQVRRARELLEERLTAEREVTATVSHRLRNPLTVIYGFAEALLDSDLDDPDEVRGIVTILSAEALDLTRTVEDLVATNDLERGELSLRTVRFDPAEELERAVVPFRRLGTDIEIDAWSGEAISDPVRVRQIVQNLVSNAVRFGGPTVRVVADVDGDRFRCSVIDDGPGVDDDLLDALPITRSDVDRSAVESEPSDADDEQHDTAPRRPIARSGGEGLGLGLSVAAEMAVRLGGSIEYLRTDGFTTVTLVLPVEGWSGAEPVDEFAETTTEPEDPTPENLEPAEPSRSVAS